MWDEKLPLSGEIQLIGPTTFFLVVPHSTWDPGSPTRDRNRDPCSGSLESATGLPGYSQTTHSCSLAEYTLNVPEVSIRRQNLGPAFGILSSKCDQVWLNPDLHLAAINWLADINSVSSSGLIFPVVAFYSLSCVQILFDPNDCSPPCSFVHGISEARGFFTTEPPGKTCISSTHLQNKNARGLKHAASQCADVKSTT